MVGRDWPTRIVMGLGVATLINALAIATIYGLYPGFLDDNESSLSIMAQLMLNGQPVYQAIDTPDRLTHAHGPLTFLWNAWPQLLLPYSAPAWRLGATLFTVTMPLMVLASQIRRGAFAAGLAMVLGGAAIILHLNASVIMRPDMPVTVLVAVAVWLAGRRDESQGWGTTLALGLCVGLAMGFKINAVLPFVPVVLFHAAGGRWLPRLMVIGAVAGLTALTPFLGSAFSLVNFLDMLRHIGGKENTWFDFKLLWAHFAIYLILPPLAWAAGGREAWSRADGRTRLYLGAYVVCVLLTLFPATKIGAGHYYFMPLIAITVDLTVRATAGTDKRQRRAVLAALLVVVTMFWQIDRRFLKSLDWTEARAVTAEIKQIIAENPGQAIQMGVGGARVGNQLSLRFYAYRQGLVATGNPYTLDVGLSMELNKLGVPEPPEMIERLWSCKTNLWLVPKGESPFILRGSYGATVFSQEFRDTFLLGHEKVASHDIFDVYACRRQPIAPYP